VNVLLYFNAHDEAIKFTLPSSEYASAWDVVISTAGEDADDEPVQAGEALEVPAKSLAVLRAYTEPEAEPEVSVSASLAVRAGAGSDTAAGKAASR
jgi:isoamylase